MFGWTVAAGCLVLAFWLVRLAEPRSFEEAALAVVALLMLGPATAIVVVLAWLRRMWVVAAAATLALAVAIGLTLGAGRLHWWMSRDDFESVANGRDLRCAEGEDCRLGWWRVTGTTRLDTMVIVWLPEEGCYAGYALAKPQPGVAGAAAVTATARAADLPSDSVTASRWRDGWYELCFTT